VDIRLKGIHLMLSEDNKFMAHAIELARNGLYSTAPNPRVGCVVVKDGQIIAEGWHERAGEAHAEVLALRCAGEQAKGATVYVTLEPCCHFGRTPPCSQALIDAGVSRVVVGMQDPNPCVAGQGLQALRQQGIGVTLDVLRESAQALNSGFIKRMRFALPYIRTKMGMSVDGRTAMATGESQWITSSNARQDVQHLRARSCAVITGIGTVLADDPLLNVRNATLVNARSAQPVRVVVDSQLRIKPSAKLFQAPGKVMIATCVNDAKKLMSLREVGADVVQLPAEGGCVDLVALCHELAARDVNEILLEAGSTLNGAFLMKQLIDEIILYMAPVILGNFARGLFNLPCLTQMQDKLPLTIKDIRAIGCDWRITAIPSYPNAKS